jgi:hypothetical protein
MKRIIFLLGVLLLCCSFDVHAQYWVEFNPGTCQVGPPPVCVAGHWYWVEVPEVEISPSAAVKAGKSAGSESKREEFHKPSEISTDLEYETFSHSSVEGRSFGFRAFYETTTSSGFSFGTRGSYERTSIKDSEVSPGIFSGNVYVNQSIMGFVSIAGGFFYSRFSRKDVNPLTSMGPFINLSYGWFNANSHIGGGFSYTFAKVKFDPILDESQRTASFGINAGTRLGEHMYGAAEIFRLKDDIYITGASLTRAFSETFGLTLGMKKLFGIKDFSNFKITLGQSVRF